MTSSRHPFHTKKLLKFSWLMITSTNPWIVFDIKGSVNQTRPLPENRFKDSTYLCLPQSQWCVDLLHSLVVALYSPIWWSRLVHCGPKKWLRIRQNIDVKDNNELKYFNNIRTFNLASPANDQSSEYTSHLGTYASNCSLVTGKSGCWRLYAKIFLWKIH